MGRGERATVERPVATDHLQDAVDLDIKSQEKNQQTIHLIHFAQNFVKSNYEPLAVRTGFT